VQKVRTTDLSPKSPSNPNGITNHDMGLTFEELIRRFSRLVFDLLKLTDK
jgi:type I restriction enzyme M protein